MATVSKEKIQEAVKSILPLFKNKRWQLRGLHHCEAVRLQGVYTRFILPLLTEEHHYCVSFYENGLKRNEAVRFPLELIQALADELEIEITQLLSPTSREDFKLWEK